MISFNNITLNEKSREFVTRVIEEGNIGQSYWIEAFEAQFARYLGVKYCIAVSSGTMADAIALAVLKYEFPGKTKVAVPALTFIAQVNSILYNGLTPVFYDERPVFDEDTLCIFPVHLLGTPVLEESDFQQGVPVIEDACEALGSRYKGKLVGTFGDMGTFSFFPSHTISTGEGGMIATDNEEYAMLARSLRNHGKSSPDSFHFDMVGFNGKMTSVSAAIGISLMNDLPTMAERRHQNFLLLGGIEEPEAHTVPHGFPRMAKDKEERDEWRERLFDAGIDSRNLFSSIPTQEKAYAFMGHKLGDFPSSEDIGNRGLYVPIHQGLTIEELIHIKKTLHIA